LIPDISNQIKQPIKKEGNNNNNNNRKTKRKRRRHLLCCTLVWAWAHPNKEGIGLNAIDACTGFLVSQHEGPIWKWRDTNQL
jgi:hypothetical protein